MSFSEENTTQQKNSPPQDTVNTAPFDQVNTQAPVPSKASSKDSKPKEPDTLVIKGKFKFGGSGIYGIFSIILSDPRATSDYSSEHNDNPIIGLNLIASYFSDLFYTDIKESWISLEKTFNNIQISGEFASSITNSFRSSLMETFSSDGIFARTIISDYYNENFTNIEKGLESVFTRIHKDRKINIEIVFEHLSSDDIRSIKKDRIMEEIPEANTDVLETPSIVINSQDISIPANPILAPNDGISANQLSRGLRILMRIDASHSYGQKWIEIYRLFNKDSATIYPLIGTVDQIGPVIKNSLDIMVKYQENQYSKFNIEAGVKLKVYNPNLTIAVVDPLALDISPKQMEGSQTLHNLIHEKNFKFMATAGIALAILSFIALYFI